MKYLHIFSKSMMFLVTVSVSAILMLANTQTVCAQEWSCEQYQGNIPADVSAQFQAGDIVHLGGYQLKSAPVDGVVYHMDNTAYQNRVAEENRRFAQTVEGLRKIIKVYKGACELGLAGNYIDWVRDDYSKMGLDYDAICAEFGYDPNTGKPIGGSAATDEDSSTPVQKVVSHGLYDSLDDTAEKAFVALLAEGDENNGYIQVKADAEDFIISRDAVNATKLNGRDGRVEFLGKIEDNAEKYEKFTYSVTFPQVEVENDVDLHAEFTELLDSQFEDMHALTFSKQVIGADIIVKLHYGDEAEKAVYVLTGTNDDDYDMQTVQQTDENGNITFTTNTLDHFIVTTTDVVSAREAIAKAEAEEQARVEAEKKAEEERKAAEEAERIAKEEHQRAEEERLAAEAVAAEQAKIVAEEQKRSRIGLILIGTVVILSTMGIYIFRGRLKKNEDMDT